MENVVNSFKHRIERLNELINVSNNIVFFGGAGVSTESGIPDFRSKDGLYNNMGVDFEKYSAEFLLSHTCLYNYPKVFYEFYRQKMNCNGIMPNITHYKLAELENIGKLKAVITQNIDGLHQKAGSKNVLEIHGTTLENYCHFCNEKYPSGYIFECEDAIPKCECGGMIRPNVTLYGENLPREAWSKACDVIERADLLIIGGTSMTVYPANTLIQYYNGYNIILINRDITEFDNQATILFHENLGKVFDGIKVDYNN